MAQSLESDNDTFIPNLLPEIERLFGEVVRLLSTDRLSSTNYRCVISRLNVLSNTISNLSRIDGPSADCNTLQNKVVELRDMAQQKHQNNTDQSTSYRLPSTTTGRGRPRLELSREILDSFRKSNFTAVRIAETLNVSVNTVHNRLRESSLRLCDIHTDIQPIDLQEKVKEITTENRNLGERMIRARLLSTGINVTRAKVRAAITAVDPAGAAMRAMQNKVHRRRQYSVAGPNSLWHFDGNHKLIRYNIVIHGCIDGFSRMVIYIIAADNNRAQTVLDVFMKATEEHGLPSRTRCDRGGENVSVCAFMEKKRGANRGSAIQGRSVHNQRIERLWVDVWKSATQVFYQAFHFLEEEKILEIDNQKHMWCLHFIFLPRINQALSTFATTWNNHGIRTETGCPSPKTLFMEGMLKLSRSNHTAVKEVFSRQDDEGVDMVDVEHTDGAAREELDGRDTTNAVVVPRIPCPFTEQQLDLIKQQFDPLQNDATDPHGLNLLKELLSHVSQLT